MWIFFQLVFLPMHCISSLAWAWHMSFLRENSPASTFPVCRSNFASFISAGTRTLRISDLFLERPGSNLSTESKSSNDTSTLRAKTASTSFSSTSFSSVESAWSNTFFTWKWELGKGLKMLVLGLENWTVLLQSRADLRGSPLERGKTQLRCYHLLLLISRALLELPKGRFRPRRRVKNDQRGTKKDPLCERGGLRPIITLFIHLCRRERCSSSLLRGHIRVSWRGERGPNWTSETLSNDFCSFPLFRSNHISHVQPWRLEVPYRGTLVLLLEKKGPTFLYLSRFFCWKTDI